MWYIALIGISVSGAAVEELVYRGYVQRSLLPVLPPSVAIFITATGFSVAHAPDLSTIFVAAIGGIWFGTIAWYANSVWPAIWCHAVFNVHALTFHFYAG